ANGNKVTLTLSSSAANLVRTGTVAGGAATGTLSLTSPTTAGGTSVLALTASASNGCTTSTAGTYISTATLQTQADNIANAINSCHGFSNVDFIACTTGVAATGCSTPSSNQVRIVATVPGTVPTVTESVSNFTLATTTAGNDGSNATCTGSGA